MAIKSPQTLISEALKLVKTITPEEAMNLVNENKSVREYALDINNYKPKNINYIEVIYGK